MCCLVKNQCISYPSEDSQITNFLQGYVDNEFNLNIQQSCQSSCYAFSKTRNYGCSEETYCHKNKDKRSVCNGVTRDCLFIEGDMTICASEAKPISMDDKQITYRTTETPREIHVKMLQENIDTLEKMFSFVTKIHRDKRCLGTRQIISEEDEIQPNGRVFKKYNMGEYKWMNFIEVERTASSFGRGLRELGQKPKQNIVIFAETSAEWMIAAHGCFKQNIPIVTIYATLGDDGVIHGINETEVTTVITTHELLPKFKTMLTQMPNVTHIVYTESQLHKTDTSDFKPGVQIIPFSQVIRLGIDSKFGSDPPKAEDIAIIMYTSGSTGTPN